MKPTKEETSLLARLEAAQRIAWQAFEELASLQAHKAIEHNLPVRSLIETAAAQALEADTHAERALVRLEQTILQRKPSAS